MRNRVNRKMLDTEIRKKPRRISQEAMMAYIFVSIPLIGYLIFSIFPVIISFCMQFTSMTGFDLSTMEWNHFENFKRVFEHILYVFKYSIFIIEKDEFASYCDGLNSKLLLIR